MADDRTGARDDREAADANDRDDRRAADANDRDDRRAADADADADVDVRRARHEDHDEVAAFTEDTWPERDADDYVPRAFPDWVDAGGPGRRTFVAEVDGAVVGLVGAVMLSAWEAWFQGMRVHPGYRGRGVSGALNDACLEWARERGAAVGRLMVFAWNVPALSAARANGFEPVTEFRWAHPEPDPDAAGADGSPPVREAPDDAYAFWTDSDAREHLRGLGLDLGESWACSAVTRETLRDAPRVLAVGRPLRAVSYRTRTYEREADDGTPETRAEYGAAAWRDLDACRDLLAAVGRDAAAAGADRTRVLVPETARHVSDAARAGADLSEEPDFVLAADLTGE